MERNLNNARNIALFILWSRSEFHFYNIETKKWELDFKKIDSYFSSELDKKFNIYFGYRKK